MNKSEASAADLMEFSGFTIDLNRELIIRDGTTVSLRPQTFKVLRQLVQKRGQLVDKQVLFDTVWGDTVVTDDSLTQCLVEIRKALGQQGRKVVRTLPRRGYIFEGVPVEHPPATPDRARIRRAAIVCSLLITAVMISVFYYAISGESGEQPQQEAVKDQPIVVAVLPFKDFTQSGDSAYLGYGLAEETLNRLTLVPELRVIARTSSFATALSDDLTIAELAERLGATHAVEGSIREHNGNLRITAQLIETSNEYHLWSESFDHPAHDLLRVQDQIASAITGILKLEFTEHEGGANAITSEDHDRYLRASYLLRTQELLALQEARQILERVVSRNPQHLPSIEKLFTVYRSQFRLGELNAESADTLIGQLAASIETFEPADLIVQTALGEAALDIRGDLPSAAKHLSSALAMSYDRPATLRASGDLARYLGRFEDAILLLRASIAMDPLCRTCYINLAYAYMGKGEYGRAEKAVREFMKFSRGGHFSLALVKTLQGEFDAARNVLSEPFPAHMQRYQDYYMALLSFAEGDQQHYGQLRDQLVRDYARIETVRIAQLYAWGDNLDEANRQARMAYERFPTQLKNSLQEPVWGKAMQDPNFQSLLHEMERSPEQLKAIVFDFDYGALGNK